MNFGLVGPDGKDVVSQTLELTEQTQTFEFDDIPKGSVPSLFRNFSSPIILDAPYSDEDYLHLMVNDSDGFNQWDAGFCFVMNKVMEQIDKYEAGETVTVNSSVVEAFRDILNRDDMDDRLKNLALSVPTCAEITNLRKQIDPQAILAVRNAFLEELGSQLHDEWKQAYEDRYQPETPHNRDGVGRRAMHRHCPSCSNSIDSSTQQPTIRAETKHSCPARTRRDLLPTQISPRVVLVPIGCRMKAGWCFSASQGLKFL